MVSGFNLPEFRFCYVGSFNCCPSISLVGLWHWAPESTGGKFVPRDSSRNNLHASEEVNASQKENGTPGVSIRGWKIHSYFKRKRGS